MLCCEAPRIDNSVATSAGNGSSRVRVNDRGTNLTLGSNVRRHVLGRLIAACGVAFGLDPLAHGQAASGVVVLMPDIEEPFRSIFLRIVEGIEMRISGPADVVSINTQTPGQIAAEVQRRQARLVVAMGRQGLKSISALQGNVPIIASCVVSVQESEIRGYPVYTLAPDPAALFAHLRRLIPSTRRVSVVVDPRQNSWLLKRALEAARPLSIEVVAHETDDPAAALRLYAQILRGAESGRDVLWLPQDSTTVIEDAVLPFVLKESWNRGVAVFSSQLAHVKRGVLFALYPNERGLGQTLGDAAVRMLAGGKVAEGILPLRDVRIAINTRNASHLGLSVQVAAYDLVYPVP
jgi:putative tryptophan/tyrosine transport system substrate-binding protein